MRSRSIFQHPLHCPRGHRQISWFAAENVAHCWLCEKDYPLSECFGKPTTSSPSDQEHEIPESLEIKAGTMERASRYSQKNWAKQSTKE